MHMCIFKHIYIVYFWLTIVFVFPFFYIPTPAYQSFKSKLVLLTNSLLLTRFYFFVTISTRTTTSKLMRNKLFSDPVRPFHDYTCDLKYLPAPNF